MQVESLKIFCDVARLRSFSRAATANHLTQSAASHVVLQLERRLGVQLINRSTRPLLLTDLGKTYYEGCQRLLDEYLELEASIRQTQTEISANVQVAAIYSVGLGDLGLSIERFKTMQPNARVQIEYLHPDRVYEKVLEGTADFGLISFPKPRRLLTALPWREETMVLTCSPNHPLAGAVSIKPSVLAGVKYIGFDKNLVIRREVDRFLRDQGVVVDVVLEFDNIETIKKAVELGAGVALLPEPTLRREVASGTLVALSLAGCRLVRPLGIIHHRQRQLSSTACRFIEMLRQKELDGDANHVAAKPNGNEKSTRKKTRLASV